MPRVDSLYTMGSGNNPSPVNNRTPTLMEGISAHDLKDPGLPGESPIGGRFAAKDFGIGLWNWTSATGWFLFLVPSVLPL